MKTDVKAKWLEALRSGEYEQGKQYLRSADDKFCCLGVLCDLAVKQGVIEGPIRRGLAENVPWTYDYETSGLSEEVMEWSGVKGALGNLPANDYSLAWLNDTGKTFAEIADIIEREY